MNIILEILTFGAAFMLGLLFITVHSNNKGNIFIGLFLWNLAYLLFDGILSEFYDIEINLYFDVYLFILVFLFLYLITTINRPFKKWYLLLFIPGIIQNIANLTLKISDDKSFDFIELFYFFELLLILYFFIILRNHRIMLNNYYSNVELKTLSWLKILVFLVLLLHFTWIMEIIPVDNEIPEIISNYMSALIMFSMVYWIGFNGFTQSEIFQGGFFYNLKREDKKEFDTPILENTIADFELLKEKIIEQRLYATQNLTLRDLASSTNMKEKDISLLINLHSGTTFYHFINGFRIGEFKKSMNSSKSIQLTVFGLAQEVGFTSKSTFYSAFRAVEGMTPKEYESTLKEFE